MWPRVAFVASNVPENTPIHAAHLAMPIAALDSTRFSTGTKLDTTREAWVTLSTKQIFKLACCIYRVGELLSVTMLYIGSVRRADNAHR